jgi:DNA-binding GntR family transcriptional regulator
MRDDNRLPVSKAAYVASRIREEIVSGRLVPGESLRQSDLAERYGVSPTPVREALRLLEAEGAVDYSPHRGAAVAEVTRRRIEDIYLLRASVEALATSLCVQRQGPAGFDRAKKVHERLKKATTARSRGVDLSRLNREFHFEIYDKGSTLISQYINTLWRLMPPEPPLWSAAAAADVLIVEHAGILDAALRGDAERAAALMSSHVISAMHVRLDRMGECPESHFGGAV